MDELCGAQSKAMERNAQWVFFREHAKTASGIRCSTLVLRPHSTFFRFVFAPCRGCALFHRNLRFAFLIAAVFLYALQTSARRPIEALEK